ncbi:MAG: class I SAM-dependent methyltransferase [Oligoflexia bacterium]|nr:class I SAM-dependent methyltransferase [Oligoflexia bacterium]MBF0366861.1 class I SAM-dependent methyltransferase [Oligoflexia bacterium]
MEGQHTLTLDEKYHLYESSVQYPRADIDFFKEQYQKFFHRSAKVLREDFCGTGKLSCEWVQESPSHMAYSIDLDPLPIEYGKRKHLAALSASEQKRIHYFEDDVMNSGKILGAKALEVDVVAALNFSFCFFKERSELRSYFTSVLKSMKKESLLVLDLFGGIDAQSLHIDETDYEGFTYYWDCDKFNPISSHCIYKIHYKRDCDEHKQEAVFEYDWRLWSLPEVREILLEAGFQSVHIFWEGEKDDGSGDGVFTEALEAENCDTWVCYIVALP